MATSSFAAAAKTKLVLNTVFQEFVSTFPLHRFMEITSSAAAGTPAVSGLVKRAPIQVKRQPSSKFSETVVFNILGGSIAWNDGTTKLEDNEQAGVSYADTITLRMKRAAKVVTAFEAALSTWDLLAEWQKYISSQLSEEVERDLVAALGYVDGVPYATATATNKNNWTVANADRVLFGNSVANYNATHATALANVAAGQIGSVEVLRLLRQRAAEANDLKIKPWGVTGNDKMWLWLVPPAVMRALRSDNTIATANRDAMMRSQMNPVFHADDLIFESVQMVEVPNITPIVGAGAGGIDVYPTYFLGGEAIGMGFAGDLEYIGQIYDHGFLDSRGVMLKYGQKKLVANGKDYSVVTNFLAGV